MQADEKPGAGVPESSKLLGASVFLNGLTEGEERDSIMTQFYEAVKDHMDDIQDRNIVAVRKIIADTPVLRNLGLVEIVNDPDFEQSHEVFFKYLDNLTSMCRMRFEVSERMMNAIESVGRDVAARVQGGYTPRRRRMWRLWVDRWWKNLVKAAIASL